MLVASASSSVCPPRSRNSIFASTSASFQCRRAMVAHSSLISMQRRRPSAREAAGNTDRAIAREGADFDGRAHLEHGCQQRQERALFAADEHLADRAELFGLRPQIIEDRIEGFDALRCT